MILIFFTIILISGTLIGSTAYFTAKNQAHDQIRDSLEKRSEDWARIIKSYAEEAKYVKEREDLLIKNQLNSTSLAIRESMKFSDELDGGPGMTSMEERERMFMSLSKIDIEKDGYIFIIGTEGDDKGRYLLSKDGTRDGENIYYGKDEDGNFIIRNIIGLATEKTGEPIIVEYTWINPGDDGFREKIASVVYYQPWNCIIGASAYVDDYRSDFTNEIMERSREMISRQVIGETGYFWVLQGSGEKKGSYIVSNDRSRDGENLWDVQDSEGRYFVREIISKGKESPEDAVFYHYEWKNEGEEKERTKVAAITYVEEWDWVIGASAYENEFLEDVFVMRNQIILLTLLELIIAIGAAYIIGTKFARTITNPLKRLTRKAEQIGSGEVRPEEIETSVTGGSKELRALARTLEDARIARFQNERATEELERSEARLKELTSMLPEIVFEADGDTSFIFFNNIALRKLGYDGNVAHSGLKLREIIARKDRKRFYKKLKELVKGRESAPEEFTIVRKDMTTFPGLINMDTILKDGKAVGYRGIIIDITGRKKSETKIREEKNKAEFYLDMLSHDIGNLHMGLSSSIDMALMSRDDPEAQERILKIAKNISKRSMKLTDSVMLLSRIRSERTFLERIDVKKMIEEGAELARDTYPDKNIHVQINGASRRINAEPILKEAFYNIISNGIKVQKDSDPWIEISIKDIDNDQWVSIEICDRGYGIPDREKQRVFERFWTSGKESRIGLGLSIVRGLVERYDGRLFLEDRIKGDHLKGTKFIIQFPKT